MELEKEGLKAEVYELSLWKRLLPRGILIAIGLSIGNSEHALGSIQFWGPVQIGVAVFWYGLIIISFFTEVYRVSFEKNGTIHINTFFREDIIRQDEIQSVYWRYRRGGGSLVIKISGRQFEVSRGIQDSELLYERIKDLVGGPASSDSWSKIPPSKEVYEKAWREYRKWNHSAIVLFLAFLPSIYFTVTLSRGSAYVVFPVVAAWIIAFMYCYSQIRSIRCPRCNERFAIDGGSGRNTLGRKCANCGLKRYAQP